MGFKVGDKVERTNATGVVTGVERRGTIRVVFTLKPGMKRQPWGEQWGESVPLSRQAQLEVK